jgi:hypothetical protein
MLRSRVIAQALGENSELPLLFSRRIENGPQSNLPGRLLEFRIEHHELCLLVSSAGRGASQRPLGERPPIISGVIIGKLYAPLIVVAVRLARLPDRTRVAVLSSFCSATYSVLQSA